MRPNRLGEALTGPRRKTLGVVEPFDGTLRVEDHGGHGNRPGECAAADLIHPCD
jgi:hypothetical protein